MRLKWVVERRRLDKCIDVDRYPAAAGIGQMRTDIGAAAGADQEVGGLETKAVADEFCRRAHHNPNATVRIARVPGAVDTAEAAHAGAQTEHIQSCARFKHVSEIAAMTASLESRHETSPVPLLFGRFRCDAALQCLFFVVLLNRLHR